MLIVGGASPMGSAEGVGGMSGEHDICFVPGQFESVNQGREPLHWDRTAIPQDIDQQRAMDRSSRRQLGLSHAAALQVVDDQAAYGARLALSFLLHFCHRHI